MRPVRLFSPLVLACIVQAIAAQSHKEGVSLYDQPGTNRTFALVDGTSVMVNGASWPDGRVGTYGHAHPGHYIVFQDGEKLRRIDDSTPFKEAERAYAPLLPLNARQKQLAEQQKPFAEQQRILAEEQRAAQGHPEEQGRIGEEQGRVGQQQGALGEKQGEIGRQQDIIGEAFYNKVQAMLSACLADHSCPVISAENAGR